MRRRSCAERYLNGDHGGWADTVPICAWLPARAKLAPRAIEGPRARKCVLWHQANLNPPTEMTVRIRKMRACVSLCACVRVVRVCVCACGAERGHQTWDESRQEGQILPY